VEGGDDREGLEVMRKKVLSNSHVWWSLTLVVCLALVTTASTDAQQDQRPDTAADLLPGEAMYAGTSKNVWKHVQEMVTQLGFRGDTNDSSHQVLVTRWRDYDEHLLPDSTALRLPPTDRPLRVQLHVAVAPNWDPARVAIGSIVQIQRRESGRSVTIFAYRHPALDTWVFASLDSRLGVQHQSMPATPAERAAQAARLMPSSRLDKCATTDPYAGKQPIKPPTKITDVQPIFPAEGAESGDRKVQIRAVLTEHGTVTDPQIINPSSSVAHYEASARAAFGLWRFTPAMIGDCPKVSIMTLTVNYRLQ
jgi:hypothetical protein